MFILHKLKTQSIFIKIDHYLGVSFLGTVSLNHRYYQQPGHKPQKQGPTHIHIKKKLCGCRDFSTFCFSFFPFCLATCGCNKAISKGRKHVCLLHVFVGFFFTTAGTPRPAIKADVSRPPSIKASFACVNTLDK